ncbi:HlyD family secretion protein [Reinekea thalattae]|uniref:HlyD family efflux transporter periplasmic adaptor subunit n=1 Tax=Reinekea thalattae TaxID=2593301 RepID=A0A5C8Z3V4_9GAMM|nr:HlyD family efflux transporter periplasmic adaptor subunit [Reinekea thalattae]TXR51939.1 HlyD family efflux transporter periplasmic adaptor subunit [Reinekea thalattae]
MKRPTRTITIIYLIALLGFICFGYFTQTRNSADVIQAHFDAPELRISAKIAGRVGSIEVEEGDVLAPGDLVFTLDSPEIDAKLTQVQALIEAKQAMKARANRGARAEEVAIAKDSMLRAQAGAELAQKSLARLQNLYDDGLVSEQKLDEAQAQAQSSQYLLEAAQEQYQLALKGTEEELKEAAESDLKAAQGQLAEVQAAIDETRISATDAGEVTSILINEGEIAPAGFPVVTLIDMQQAYIRFHLTEDQLSFFTKGSQFNAYLPAFDKEVEFTVYYVSSMGSYATWRASKPGDYDLKTFEVRARPAMIDDNWRAGMSAIIELPKAAR